MNPMKRRPDSHKGENGKVAVIGGCRLIHGAPILSALAAEASGVDLVYLCLPQCHQEVAKVASLNFQVHPFSSDELVSQDTKYIVELLATMDAAVIGPGIARTEESITAVKDCISEATCPLVLDATALQPETLHLLQGKQVVLTPHLAELERMEIASAEIRMIASKHAVTFVLKGQVDRIAGSDGKVHEVTGGNAGLTVGGTGDALAGLIAGLLAQGEEPVQAGIIASTVIKRAGEALFEQSGYSYTARDVIEMIPYLLHTL